MLKLPDQIGWNEVLIGAGFVTVNMPCFFTFKTSPTDIDIHYTTDTQIHSTSGQTLYIKHSNYKTKVFKYAREP
jgi:hypothetical protein